MRHVHYNTIDSTNSAAWRLADGQPEELLLVTACEQSAGRGKHARAWQSPIGGVWMSLYWPKSQGPTDYAATPLVAAVALRRSLAELVTSAEAELAIKWPNDLLIDGCKVAGILCEQRTLSNSPRGSIVIGIGINADFEVSRLRSGLRHPPTTLRAILRRPVDVANLTVTVTRQVIQAMTEFELDGLSAELLAELREHLAYVGTQQRWYSHGHVRTGQVVGIDGIGRLLLSSNSETLAFNVGELVVEADIVEPEPAIGGE